MAGRTALVVLLLASILSAEGQPNSTQPDNSTVTPEPDSEPIQTVVPGDRRVFGCRLLQNGTGGPDIGNFAMIEEPSTGLVTHAQISVKSTLIKQIALHGLHIHEKASTDDGCEAAGAHWNPTGVSHGCPGHHGDLGNVQSALDGFLGATVVLAKGVDATKFFGRAVVLHSGPDDCKTQPSGNSGTRIACCVIKLLDVPVEQEATPNAQSDGDQSNLSIALWAVIFIPLCLCCVLMSLFCCVLWLVVRRLRQQPGVANHKGVDNDLTGRHIPLLELESDHEDGGQRGRRPFNNFKRPSVSPSTAYQQPNSGASDRDYGFDRRSSSPDRDRDVRLNRDWRAPPSPSNNRDSNRDWFRDSDQGRRDYAASDRDLERGSSWRDSRERPSSLNRPWQRDSRDRDRFGRDSGYDFRARGAGNEYDDDDRATVNSDWDRGARRQAPPLRTNRVDSRDRPSRLDSESSYREPDDGPIKSAADRRSDSISLTVDLHQNIRHASSPSGRAPQIGDVGRLLDEADNSSYRAGGGVQNSRRLHNQMRLYDKETTRQQPSSPTSFQISPGASTKGARDRSSDPQAGFPGWLSEFMHESANAPTPERPVSTIQRII